mmetsp:Transcript_40727/g.53644  ORF Transcript_40727/g.53644 Transcript_40727/m.53644 type:complete len:322 (+) Transcript_40727:154-1119(+)|eukprot:CAMPEP_0117738432 /NCGR_PEP_ID=MMETSP0947-20121206/3123_1 /TAXON_ID=44440 /ORGANISM="Chattonella subsalsa, Strain CCMP2191" /LENGTH=321 /DNA_ID=CAMNT_0005554115 /DNA_START=139 /DNA_END=1104 /DNA_ORIENTATION=-
MTHHTNNKREQHVAALSPIGSSKGSTSARVLGSACAGVSELALFHPVDTVAKRLMSNQTQVFVSGQSLAATASNLNEIIFKEAASKPIFQRYQSLFPGISYGAGYKILQRVYKFGGQPYVRDLMTKAFGDQFTSAFGEKKGKALLYAFAGSLMGVGEIVLLPLDVLKIKAQTNPESLKGRGIIDIFSKEGMGLYRGAGWTAARNAPGSFALFGGSSFTKEYIFKLENYSDATFFQDTIASVAGATASITVAAPLDVVKTRIQNRPFDSPESGVTILRNLVRNEGFGAFFKGLTPKLLVVGPKLIFSFTVAQQMIGFFERRL